MIIEDNRYTGVILRMRRFSHHLYRGYINYYIHDGERAAKDAKVYLVDETGRINDALDKAQAVDPSMGRFQRLHRY